MESPVQMLFFGLMTPTTWQHHMRWVHRFYDFTRRLAGFFLINEVSEQRFMEHGANLSTRKFVYCGRGFQPR
jgi:hypothetical protein